MSPIVQRITGKPGLAHMGRVLEGKPTLAELKTTPLTAKMWITPEHEIVPLTNWHFEYFRDPAIAEKYGVTYSDEQNTRLDALRAGFVRVNYERNGGLLTVESGERGWSKTTKDTVFMLVADNARSIDAIRVSVLDDTGRIKRTGYSQLFTYDDMEKIEHIPLVSESAQGRSLLQAILGT